MNADRQVVEFVMLGGAIALSAGLAFGVCRIFLTCLFAVMSNQGLPFVFHWKRVFFASALFWFWYLTPVVAASETATRLLRLLANK
jgi:hypothetical protein